MAAYHATRDGSVGSDYDRAAAEHVVVAVTSGATWKQAMSSAANDTVRLTALDLASPVRVGVRTFVDDVRVKCASGGHTRMVVACLEAVARMQRYSFGFGCGKIETTGEAYARLFCMASK